MVTVMKKISFLFVLFCICAAVQAQPVKKRPKLVVGIVVDQMRYDYLYRYWDKYSAGGIRRLVQQGFSFENTHYNYVPTYTGPGHAAIYTGTTPAINGIAGNDWYNRTLKRSVYVTEDTTVQTVGSGSANGKMSPAHLLTTTITDELEIFTQRRAKVIGISIKDRGAILPAGHAADAAYWYDPSAGVWISSTFYMNELPLWVQEFNNKKLPDQYLSQEWTPLLPLSAYTESTADDVPYEVPFKGETKPVFPHSLKDLRSAYNYGLLSYTPWGNTLVADFALETIRREKMGSDDITDFLAVSFSSTDYVGHQFGPDAIETEDTYLRLDLELQRLFAFLDQEVGKENVLIFFTADHGGMNAIGYLQEMKIPAGYFDYKKYIASLEAHMVQLYGAGDWVLHYDNQQVYLNRELIGERKLLLEDVVQQAIRFTVQQPGVLNAVSGKDLAGTGLADPLVEKMRKGFSISRSGDLAILLQPGWMDAAAKGGTSHGSPYAYDTHVPLVFMGGGIPAGKTMQPAYITDIAPTLAYLLGIMEPNGCTGAVLEIYGQTVR